MSLAAVESLDEYTKLSQTGRVPLLGKFWLGASDSIPDARNASAPPAYRWVSTGRDADRKDIFWQVDAYKVPIEPEHSRCALIDQSNELQVDHCHQVHNYICEKPANQR